MNQLISECENDQSLICGIKKYLSEKKDLDQFTSLQVSSSVNCPDDTGSIFQMLLRTKILAQTMLNLYYNERVFENCTLYEGITDDVECTSENSGIPRQQSPNIDVLIATILKYVVLFRILAKREGSIKKGHRISLCEFCDNKLGEEDAICSICLAEVDPPNSDDNVSSFDADVLQRFEESSSFWKCSMCTFCNKLSNEKCDACLNERFKYVERDQPIERTFLSNSNDNWRNENNMETSQSYHSVLVKRKSKEEWVCRNCTMINKIENQCCEACFTVPEPEIDESIKSLVCQHCQTQWHMPWSMEECRSLTINWVCDHCIRINNLEGNRLQSREQNNTVVSTDTENDWILINIEKGKKLKRDINHMCENSLSYSSRPNSITSVDVDIAQDWVQIRATKDDVYDTISEENVYCCDNRCCGAINNKMVLHSCLCSLSNGSDETEFNIICVYEGEKFLRFWQCAMCGAFSLKNNNMLANKNMLCPLV